MEKENITLCDRQSFEFRGGDDEIMRITADNVVTYRGRPLTHEELAEAMHLWLIFKGELTLDGKVKR